MADDDDIILKLKYELDDAGVEQQSMEAAQKAGAAFQKGFKPQIAFDAQQIDKSRIDAFAKTLSDKFGSSIVTSGTALQKWEEQFKQKSLGGLDTADFSAFGARLKNIIRDATTQGTGEAQAGAGARDIAGKAEPYVAAVEGLTALFSGGGIAKSLETAFKPFIEEQRKDREERRRSSERSAGGGPMMIPAAEEETAEQRIQRRLQSIPGVAPGAGAAEEGEIASLLRGMLTRGALGGAAGGLLGAGTGGALGGAFGGVGGAAAGIVAQKALEGVGELGEGLEKMATEATQAWRSFDRFASVLGTSAEQMGVTALAAAKLGINFEDLRLQLTRLAIHAQQAMPEITKEYRDSGRVIAEENLKVRESELNLEKARLHREDSADKVKKAEVSLAQFEATGAQQREQATTEAALRVDAAETALQGARMRRAEAAIQLQHAPEQQRLQDIAGPLTVEGAKLGREGAQIAAEEARARFEKFKYGTEEPEEDVRERRERKEQLALDTAEHNEKQAALRVQEAEEAEKIRKEQRDQGLGPEGQAQQRMKEAENAEKQAQLSVARAEVAQKNLEIEQRIFTLQMQLAEKLRARNEAEIARREGELPKPELQFQKTRQEAVDFQYKYAPLISEGIQGNIPGYNLSQVQGEGLRQAIFQMGGFKVGALGEGGILDKLGDYLRKLPEEMQLGKMREVIGGMRGLGGLEDQDRLRRLLVTPPEEREARIPPEERQRVTEQIGRIREGFEKEGGAGFLGQKQTEGFLLSLTKMEEGMKAVPAAEVWSGVNTQLQELTTQAKGAAAALASIAAIKLPSPTQPTTPTTPTEPQPITNPVPGAGVEAGGDWLGGLITFQHGGLVGGHGSGKSDSNLARVSRGEFIIRADGGNLDAAIAHFTKGFADGGLVGDFLDAIPGYVSGGPVVATAAGEASSGGHPMNLYVGQGPYEHVGEATANARFAENLSRAATRNALTRVGGPSWYVGR